MCFVEFEEVIYASQAIKELYGHNLVGLYNLNVDFASISKILIVADLNAGRTCQRRYPTFVLQELSRPTR